MKKKKKKEEDLVWISPEEIEAEGRGPAKQPEAEAGEAKETKKGRRFRLVWEALYNCPFLLALCFTCIVAFFCSDEIGMRAIASDTGKLVSRASGSKVASSAALIGGSSGSGEAIVSRQEAGNAAGAETDMETATVGETDMGAAAVGETGVEAAAAGETDPETDADGETDPETDADGENLRAEQLEKAGKNTQDKMENAGTRKAENGNNKTIDKQENDNNKLENGENTGKTPIGTTKYEFYDPIEVNSPYYSDAGKIALTTEYPYVKENTSYFNDAAFLGDSRTLGISDYAGLDGADFYCDSGMMIFKLLEEDGVTYQKTGKKENLSLVLQEKHYGKIYIMLGMNELGYGNTAMYLDKYREVVERIREWQPDAIIYIMANLHVSEAKNNPETEFNNININDKNAAAASLANGTDIFYLDANPLFTDENGFLNAELTFDGVHLYAQHYDVWREFLMEHAVETEGNGDGRDAAE